MALLFEGLSFPLAAAGDRVPQPFVDIALPYFKDCLNFYLGQVFADTIRGKVDGQSGELACQEIGRVDPTYQLFKTTFALPYLSLALESGGFSEGTVTRERDTTKYALGYILPPLPEETIQEVAVPLLGAAAKLLALVVKNGGDECHRAGARVWTEADIVSVRIGAYELKHVRLGDEMRTVQTFPILRAEVFVVGQDSYDHNLGAGPLQVRTTIGVSGEEPGTVDGQLVQVDFTPDP